MTGLLVVFFVPVFRSYNSPEQKAIEAIDQDIATEHKGVDMTLRSILPAQTDTNFTKGFLKDKSAAVIDHQLDSLQGLN